MTHPIPPAAAAAAAQPQEPFRLGFIQVGNIRYRVSIIGGGDLTIPAGEDLFANTLMKAHVIAKTLLQNPQSHTVRLGLVQNSDESRIEVNPNTFRVDANDKFMNASNQFNVIEQVRVTGILHSTAPDGFDQPNLGDIFESILNDCRPNHVYELVSDPDVSDADVSDADSVGSSSAAPSRLTPPRGDSTSRPVPGSARPLPAAPLRPLPTIPTLMFQRVKPAVQTTQSNRRRRALQSDQYSHRAGFQPEHDGYRDTVPRPPYDTLRQTLQGGHGTSGVSARTEFEIQSSSSSSDDDLGGAAGDATYLRAGVTYTLVRDLGNHRGALQTQRQSTHDGHNEGQEDGADEASLSGAEETSSTGSSEFASADDS